MEITETEVGERDISGQAQRVDDVTPAQPMPCNDARGRVRPITPEEQAGDAKAIAAFVELMYSLPDDDPPGAWEEAMRDLDANRPHRKLFEGYY